MAPEHQKIMLEVRKYWTDYLLTCNQGVNQEQAKAGIDWLYKISGLEPPTIVFVESPLMSRFAIQYIRLFGNNVSHNDFNSVRKIVFDTMSSRIRYNENKTYKTFFKLSKPHLYDDVNRQMRSELYTKVKNQLENQIRRNQARHLIKTNENLSIVWTELTKNYDNVGDIYQDEGGIYDFSILSNWDFLSRIGAINQGSFTHLKLLFKGIFEIIMLRSYCIVSSMPESVKRDEKDKLHSEAGPAIRFGDGYQQYYWHGVSIPKEWITEKEKINKRTIYAESNIEQRRCIMEILGNDKYFQILLKDSKIIHSATDDQGNTMNLYKSKRRFILTWEYLLYLQVTCPSTHRQYVLCPPNQKSKTVWEAKASTFGGSKIQFRHGDVGLLNLNKEYEKPIIES